MSGAKGEPPAGTVVLTPERFDAATAEVAGDLYRHLFRARRLAVGDVLRAVDGRGHARRAVVEKVGREVATLALGEALAAHDPACRLTLLVTPPRPERASWLVEKATELGVDAIVWLRSERAPRELPAAALERHARVARSALQQCGGARLPRIEGPIEWPAVAGVLTRVEVSFALDPAGRQGPPRPGVTSCAVVVGPEGGWTEDERRRLRDVGCAAWSLGPRVLRVETAALAAAATVLARGG